MATDPILDRPDSDSLTKLSNKKNKLQVIEGNTISTPKTRSPLFSYLINGLPHGSLAEHLFFMLIIQRHIYYQVG